MKSRRDGKLLTLYLMKLPINLISYEIFNVRSILNLRVEIKKFRRVKKAPQCFRCQNISHVSMNCHINPKSGDITSHENVKQKLLPQKYQNHFLNVPMVTQNILLTIKAVRKFKKKSCSSILQFSKTYANCKKTADTRKKVE